MGSRTLRANLMEPLIDINSICYRQDAVENLIDDEKLMFQIQTVLLHFTDVERREYLFVLFFEEKMI